jgi:hypothetical protein
MHSGMILIIHYGYKYDIEKISILDWTFTVVRQFDAILPSIVV